MKIKLFAICSLFCLSAVLLNSCSDNEDTVRTTNIKVTLTSPDGITYTSLSDISLLLKETNTGKVTTVNNATINGNVLSTTVNEGTYNVTVEANAQYTVNGETQTKPIRGYKESIVATGIMLNVNLASFIYSPSTSGFVFKEIFYTGSLTPEGKQTSDQYFVIYNNSDQTLYADGLFISDSEFMTVEKQTYTPDIMNTAFTVSSMITVPGSGKEHPIEPGKSFIIANSAVNYKEINSNSIDLSKADFEIANGIDMDDTDNPEVPNMLNIVGNMVMHNRGFRSYVLGKMDVESETYLKDYVYTCTWKFTFEDYSFDESDDYYKVPNTWIQDAVNLSVASDFQWIVTAPSLDMGWTYCGKLNADPTRYGKSVQRKIAGEMEGRKILQDTNNSTLDFNAETVISLKK
nr:DUF4876 domain-containing protein [uncultured Bacteroides sp.]